MGSNDSEVAEFEDCTIISETEQAFKVKQDDGTMFWVPKSQVHDNSEVYRVKDHGTLTVNRWWAEANGMV